MARQSSENSIGNNIRSYFIVNLLPVRRLAAGGFAAYLSPSEHQHRTRRVPDKFVSVGPQMSHRFVKMTVAYHHQIRVFKHCRLPDHFSLAAFQNIDRGVDLQLFEQFAEPQNCLALRWLRPFSRLARGLGFAVRGDAADNRELAVE